MTKDELLDEIESDLTINQENLDQKLFSVSSLHAKYLRHFFNTKTILNRKQKELNIEYKKLYYKIRDNSSEILNQKEIIFNILGDDDYAQLNFEVEVLIDLVDILDRTVKKVNNLSFDLKNIISWQQFQAGGF